ncbi:MAG: MFS transporter [Anaerolineales bacterium]
MKNYLALLRRQTGFRKLWLASLISLTGDWFNTIASMMIVNRYTETDLAISWILIARTLPRFLLGPLAGVFADRFNRKKIMVTADLLRAGIVLSFLFVDRPERVWLIYVLTTMQFILASFFEPSSSALMPGLVETKEELLSANVLMSITWSSMLAIGAAVGGVFAGIFGSDAALIMDAATFLLSAMLVVQIPYKVVKTPSEEQVSGYRDMLEGFSYVAKRPHVLALTLIKTFGQIGSSDILIAVFAEQYFPYGQEGALSLGVMFGAAGLGALIGPLIANRYTKGDNLWSPNLWVVSLGIMVRLMGSSINWTYSNVLIQTEVPDRYLGRVFALDLGMFTLASSTSIFLTGYLLDAFPLTPRNLGLFFALAGLFPALYWVFYQARASRQAAQAEQTP